MSGLLDQAGLTAGSGLTNGAGLYRWGNFNPFDPTDLDPYLLFDTGAGSMIGTLENPTLDLDPSNQETLDVITATRAGVATYTDADGLIATASADTVRVDYTQGAELTPTKFQNIGYTDFSSGWDVYLGTTALGAGYDSQASLVCSFTGNGQAYQYFTSVEGVTYTGSFWARAVSGSGPYRLVHGNSASGTSTSITLTSEWQFFSAQFLGRSGGGTLYFGIGAQSGDSVEIAMPQVEEGTTASSFVANTTGSPKFITGATYGPRVPMILVEPSSENLVTYSEDFSNSWWNKLNGLTIDSTSQILAPDGVTLVSKINVNSGRLNKDLGVPSTLPSTGDYIFSAFYKGIAGETVLIKLGDGLTAELVTLDGTWQRIEVPVNYASSSGIVNPIDNRSSGTATEVYIWGAQLETGSVATSYIPTSGGDAAARTRAADDLVISGSAFSDFYNASEGTWYCEAVPKGNDGSENYTFILEYGTSNTDRVGFFYYVADGSLSVTGFNSNSQYYNQTKLGDSTNQLARLSYSYESGDHKSAINGTSDSDTDTVVPPANQLKLGKRIVGTNGSLVGHIKRLLFWPTHSSRL